MDPNPPLTSAPMPPTFSSQPAAFAWDPSAQPPLPVGDDGRWRRWLSGLLGIAGGSIVLGLAAGQLPYALSGFASMPPVSVALMVAQALFGVALVVVAYLGASGPLPTRGIAIAVFVLGVVVVMVLQTLRMTVGSGGPVLGTILYNPYAWLVLIGGLGWLLAMRPKPTAYLSLIAALVLFLPINMGMVMAGIDFALATLVMQGLSLAIAGVILVAGALRPR